MNLNVSCCDRPASGIAVGYDLERVEAAAGLTYIIDLNVKGFFTAIDLRPMWNVLVCKLRANCFRNNESETASSGPRQVQRIGFFNQPI